MKFLRLLVLTLIMLPSVANAVNHFGAGIGYYDDEYIYYNDKGYYDNFSTELDLYSDFDDSHMAMLNIHLYTELGKTALGATPIAYAGIGAVFINDGDNYTGKIGLSETEQNWGVRFPIGIEFMTDYDISIYAEVAPTYFFSPNSEYETTTAFGIRYYFY